MLIEFIYGISIVYRSQISIVFLYHVRVLEFRWVFGEVFLSQLLYLFLNYKLLIQIEVFVIVEGIVIENIKLWELFKQAYFMELYCVSLYVRMPKIRGLISLKVTELFQESGYLHNDPEYILIRGMVMHWETLHSFIILDNWIKPFFLKFLPILTELILVVVVEHEKEVFDVWDYLLQFEVTLCCKQMISLLFKLSNTVWSTLQGISQRLVVWDQEVRIVGRGCVDLGRFHTLEDALDKWCRFYGVYALIFNYDRVKGNHKYAPLVLSNFCYVDELSRGKALLSQAQVDENVLELVFQRWVLNPEINHEVIELTDALNLTKFLKVHFLSQNLSDQGWVLFDLFVWFLE